MKKSTLIVVAVAAALAVLVYFREWKHPPASPSKEASWKPAFACSDSSLTGFTLERKSGTVAFEKRGGTWQITAPVQTRADQSVANSIANDLCGAKVRRSFLAAGGLANYGLAQPGVTIDVQLKNGAKHVVRLGDKDFSDILVYSLVDDSKSVAMLPESLLGETNQPLDRLRDRTVLGVKTGDVTGLALKNVAGEVTLAKKSSGWQITKPLAVAADSDATDSLLSAVASAKMTQVVSETPEDLASYGLARPAVTLEVDEKNGKALRLLVGKKVEGDYYARDSSRPMIFRIGADLYKTLSKGFADLRDKALVHVDPDAVARVDVRNSHGAIACAQGADGKWTIVAPAAEKGKIIQSWKLFDPLQEAHAKKIFDSPSAALRAKLAKPAVQIILTGKSGKKTMIRISAASGDSVYAQTSASPAVYELSKQTLADLSFQASDLLL